MVDYYKIWYEKNKDKVNLRRKLRYRQDPVYRESVKAMSKRSYERKKTGMDNFIGQEYRVMYVENKNGDVVQLKLYTVTYMAKVLGVTMQTVKNWEKRELLPETPICINKWRLYTFSMISAVESALKVRDRIVTRDHKGKSFFQEVEDAWDKQLCEFDKDNLMQDFSILQEERLSYGKKSKQDA